MAFKALIIAPWGYPPQWRRVPYNVKVYHKGFGTIEISKCVTCSSTLALTSAINKSSDVFSQVKVLVLGLDTAIQPEDQEDGRGFRGRVREVYEKWLRVLLSDCKEHGCCEGVSEELFSINVLPGIGTFNGWKYLARIDDLFVKTFLKVRDELSRLGSSTWVFIDITHGINYQTISVMYASLAAVIYKLGVNGLAKTFILNSEPALGGESCIKVGSGGGANPQVINELNILDVTRLHVILNFIPGITSLGRLEYLGIEEGIKELKKYHEGEAQEFVKELSKKVLPAIKALRLGVVVPIFTGSKYNLSDYDLRICSAINTITTYRGDYEFIPKIDHKARVVSYESTSAWYLLKDVLRDVINRLCIDDKGYSLGSNNLLDFLEGVSKLYNNLKLHNLKWITDRTREELQAITNLWNGLSKIIKIPIEIYYILWHLRKGEVSLDRVKELLERVEEELSKESDARNFVAHSGLDFRSIKEFLVENGKVKSVIYDDAKLSRVLRELGVIS